MEHAMAGFDELKGVVDVLERSGMTRDPLIYNCCRIFWESGYSKPLLDALRARPGLLHRARRSADEMLDFPFWPPPLKRDELEAVSGEFPLGFANPRNDLAGLDALDFTRGLFICGAQGTGKTHPSLRLADMMLRTPPGQRGFNVIFVQRIKRDADGLALKYPWFKVLDWTDLRYNMWQVEEWDHPRDKLGSACNIFAGENFLFTLSVPPLMYAVESCYAAPGVLDGGRGFPNFRDLIAGLQGYTAHYGIKGYEMTSTLGRLTNRFVDFVREGEVLNCRTGFPVEFFLEHDLCLNVMDQNEYTVRTTVMSILYDIQRFLQKFPRPGLNTLVVVDEARWLFDVSRDRMDVPSNRIVEQWFTTCRESGFGRVVITEEPESVSKFVTGNCHFRLSFPVLGRDSIDAVKSLNNLSDEQVGFLPKLAAVGEGVFSHTGFDRPFLVRVPEGLVLEKRVSRDRVAGLMRSFVAEAHATYARVREREVVDIRGVEKKRQAELDGFAVLRLVRKNRFSHFTQIRSLSGLSSERFEAAVSWLESSGFVVLEKIRGGGTSRPRYFLLTDKACDSLGLSRSEVIAASRFRHSLYCVRVEKWLRGRGFEPVREYSAGGGAGRVDVFCVVDGRKVGFEVQLSLKREDVLENIRKCFDGFGVDELVLVSESRKDQERLVMLVGGLDGVGPADLERISFRTVDEVS